MARMVRVLVYEGPQKWIDQTMARNAIVGEYRPSPDQTIREIRLGDVEAVYIPRVGSAEDLVVVDDPAKEVK